jgi:hypothetical protein
MLLPKSVLINKVRTPQETGMSLKTVLKQKTDVDNKIEKEKEDEELWESGKK